MFVHSTIHICRYGLLVVAVLSWCQVSEAQNAPKGGEPAARPVPAQRGEDYVLRTYAVGDLVINIEDHPYSDSLQRSPSIGGGFGGGGGGMGGGGGGGMFSVPEDAGQVGGILGGPSIHPLASSAAMGGGGTNRFQLAQFGGGVDRGGPGGGMGSGDSAPSASITIADLLRVLVNTVAADTWTVNGGGEGQVEPLGTTLVVWQVPRVHERISELLDKLREGSAERRSVTIDARWLMLNSDELDSLLLPDQKGVPQVDRKRLAELTRRPGSIRGITNCLSSQLVYVLSGTMKNVVSGYIPVVGSLDAPDHDVQLAGETGPRIQLVAQAAPAAGNSRAVGYQPIVERPNFGALLEIRPTLVPLAQPEVGAVVDLKSTVTVAGDMRNGAPMDTTSGQIAPQVDRIAIETQEFATTLRMPLGKPILVGGLTYIPSSAGNVNDQADQAGSEGAAPVAEMPQLYLVLEVR